MILQSLNITNFKNIADARLDFSPKINCFLGNNGMGKSNLLDAVYYLSFCKSFSGMSDTSLIRRGDTFLTLHALYQRHGAREELHAAIVPGKRKSLKRGGKEYDKLSSHIGVFPAVLVAPADQELISGTGEERRKFADMVISQTDPVYLDQLIRYNRALQQRNKLLRDHVADQNIYTAIELAMERSAAYITQARSQWVEKLTAIFNRYYNLIAADGENPSVGYSSHLASDPNNLASLLDMNRRHDEAVGHTSVGPHRDDIDLRLNDMPVRRTASQGQCKTYTIALRLAQYDFLRQSIGMKPLLLLDDIFDKLDASRVERLVEVVSGDMFGQIFITDTNRDHLENIMNRSANDHRTWQVTHGTFSLISGNKPVQQDKPGGGAEDR